MAHLLEKIKENNRAIFPSLDIEIMFKTNLDEETLDDAYTSKSHCDQNVSLTTSGLYKRQGCNLFAPPPLPPPKKTSMTINVKAIPKLKCIEISLLIITVVKSNLVTQYIYLD